MIRLAHRENTFIEVKKWSPGGRALERRHSFIVPVHLSDDPPDEAFSNIQKVMGIHIRAWESPAWVTPPYGGHDFQIESAEPRIVERSPDLFQAEIPFTTKRSKGTVTVEIRPGTPSDRLAVSIVIREKKGK